jgi:hypothetical protein
MNLSDMKAMLDGYVDDVIDITLATRLLNAGQNKMATSARASFPQLAATVTDGTFVFPEKYHETPVLYAAAMIKAQDSSIREKESFLAQFQDALADFTENWDVPARYKDDINVQQFTATANQTVFTITKDTYTTSYSRLEVYKNDVKITTFEDNGDGTFTLATGATAGDYITAIWEVNEMFQQPPYPWQAGW